MATGHSLHQMKRTFFIPFISALVGGGVVVAVVAAFGGLSSSQQDGHDGPGGPDRALERLAEERRG